MRATYRKLARDYRRLGIFMLATMPALAAICAVLNGIAAATGSTSGYWILAGAWCASIPAWIWVGISNLHTAKSYERTADLWRS